MDFPMVSKYKEHPVDPRLSTYVACYWTHDVSRGARGSHPVMPDGCIDLLFESGGNAFGVVGTMTRTLWAETSGPTQFVGARFKAGGAVPFLRERADLLTDNRAEAEVFMGRSEGSSLKQQLLDAQSIEARLRLLERFLVGRLETGVAPVDLRIARATSKLTADPASRIDDLASELGMSRQYMRRLFLQHTGLAPKAFARVARLRRLVRALEADTPLADAALSSGYADQAHMSHEFKQLVGITPTVYRAV